MFCFLFLSNVSFAKNYDNKTINIEGSLLKLEKQKNKTYNLVLYDSNGYYKGSTFNYKINNICYILYSSHSLTLSFIKYIGLISIIDSAGIIHLVPCNSPVGEYSPH